MKKPTTLKKQRSYLKNPNSNNRLKEILISRSQWPIKIFLLRQMNIIRKPDCSVKVCFTRL
jgi:hypothetical protein